ncbi:hypothetical protein PF005_g696 [Phytophthora fragariae]|uniref:Uncharacterized protein n=1 Tax=Phytophthora fragariae TaxID=53985 RepID=A0A6A3TRD4_9STRA|nr:hypothetical protein PF003_g8390 [Phytophthora fragariae]KAE8950142.1 hypothetical protein PF009_g326 [Phytophthora fragariae]KAE9031586.1 hypothetical protein PF011_g10 [Phytophthora fragariae]KAE9140210.1 hypothetical protein PF010_g283 [Phytophthora fragariae]KAE9141335.1 hypothetical protein PF007_g291 [Phytophthora fragariae]
MSHSNIASALLCSSSSAPGLTVMSHRSLLHSWSRLTVARCTTGFSKIQRGCIHGRGAVVGRSGDFRWNRTGKWSS